MKALIGISLLLIVGVYGVATASSMVVDRYAAALKSVQQ